MEALPPLQAWVIPIAAAAAFIAALLCSRACLRRVRGEEGRARPSDSLALEPADPGWLAVPSPDDRVGKWSAFFLTAIAPGRAPPPFEQAHRPGDPPGWRGGSGLS